MAGEKEKRLTATATIVKALIPYTDQNLKLTFRPGRFFDELEKTSGFSRLTLQQSYSRLKARGYLTSDKVPELTAKGRRFAQPFIAQTLDNDARLMVIFDVPEEYADQRRQLRNLLRQLGFTQIQRSVWISDKDHVSIVKEAVDELKLGDWVEFYEASRI